MRDGPDPVAVVRDHDDGAPLRGLPLDETFDEIDGVPIECRVGFVEEQERSIDHQLPGELGPALHAVRGGTGGSIGGAGQPHGGERPRDPFGRHTGDTCGVPQVLGEGQFGEDPRINVAIRRNAVVFPAPLAPKRPTTSPASISRSTSRRI